MPYEYSSLALLTGGWMRPGGNATTLRALDICQLPPGACLLDVGCGVGKSLQMLQERSYTAVGCDCNSAYLADARAHAQVIRADVTALPFVDRSFDAILCECVLSLIDDRERLLSDIFRIVRPGGFLIVSDVTLRHDCFMSAGVSCGCLGNALPTQQVVDSLIKAGFVLVAQEDFSRSMAELAAQIIFSHGSLEAFFQLSDNAHLPDVDECKKRSFRLRDLGYTLFVAQRSKRNGDEQNDCAEGL